MYIGALARGRAVAVSSALLAGQAVGIVVDGLIGQELSTYRAELTFGRISERADELSQVIDDMAAASPVMLVIVVAALVLSIHGMVDRLRWARRGRAVDGRLFALQVLATTSIVATIAAQLLLDDGPPLGPRYLLGPFVLCLLAGVLSTGERMSAGATPIAAAGALGLAGGLLIVGAPRTTVPSFPDHWTDAQCVATSLESSESTRGFTSWLAQNTLTFWSEHSITLTSLWTTGNENFFALTPVNTEWLSDDMDFAVIDLEHVVPGSDGSLWVEEQQLAKASGEPLERHECGRYLVLDYGRGGLDIPRLVRWTEETAS